MTASNYKYGDINRNTLRKYCNNNNYININNNNNTLISLNEKSEIQEFYNEGKILITGSTGFIGKALTEKLLRTCVTVSTIYLLIRPKKGQSVEERCNDLLQNPVFISTSITLVIFYVNSTELFTRWASISHIFSRVRFVLEVRESTFFIPNNF